LDASQLIIKYGLIRGLSRGLQNIVTKSKRGRDTVPRPTSTTVTDFVFMSSISRRAAILDKSVTSQMSTLGPL
jgi:hypothetical protein